MKHEQEKWHDWGTKEKSETEEETSKKKTGLVHLLCVKGKQGREQERLEETRPSE